MAARLSEKLFFLDNDREVNELVFRIGGIFMAVLVGILAAAYFDVFKLEPAAVYHIMGLLALTEAIFYVLLRLHAPVAFVKYYGLLAMELCLMLMVSNAYFGIYISYIIVPLISCLYFDRRLTLNVTLICYLGMLAGLWFRAPGAIELAYPGYTRMSWFIAFGLGYTLEYVAVSAVLIAVSRRSRRYMQELYHRSERINDIQNKMIYRFADLVESRDDSTGKHVKRTSRYVALIAELLRQRGPYTRQLSREDVMNMELAAPLHDIGKIRIPDSVLLKPGKLTPEEFRIIMSHAAEGEKLIGTSMEGIERADFLQIARTMELSHHERWDGSGYPQGLRGNDIPLPARIMAVADVFDALVSDRCYKKAVSPDEAFKILLDGRGTHFDPYIVDAFVGAQQEILSIINE